VTVADVDEYAEQREHLVENVERDEEQLRRAVEDLKDAVERPFRLIERMKENPLPWLLSGVLLGFWLGSGSANGAEH
jgi:hypothetical protein